MTGKKKTRRSPKTAVDAETPAVPPGSMQAPERGLSDAGFPIVGIGASAGGLAAFQAFFSAMPANSEPGMAFVLVQHLAPNHKSILSELIRQYTRMQVFEVENGMPVQVNCTYIIPPGRDMALLNGALQLFEPAMPHGQRLPIDFFFCSLARDQQERAVGVVLSGTGSDGTLGVRAIKGEGGMAMTQNPESTGFDGMPRSAIATGIVDYVLPPAEMPAQLIAYAAHAFRRRSRPSAHIQPDTEDMLKKIFVLLRDHSGHNFSDYKQNTIVRRIERRMAVNQIERLGGYLRYLQQTPAELGALFKDLLIGVTSFFRDPAAFAVLQNRIIPRLFDGKPAGATIRVWVPGCSTGEEAYSIAILLREHLEALRYNFKAQVFATDIDSRAIATARAGIYPSGIAACVSPERLERFFTQSSNGGPYRIEKGIRDAMVFSEHDVIKDPPFSRLDLISCRNLLIYMGAELQKRIIPLFHYALSPGGMLFLGSSESVGEFTKLFADVDRKAKVYQRNDDVRSVPHSSIDKCLFPFQGRRAARQTAGDSRVQLREVTEWAMLQQYAAVGVLVDEHGDILYLHGRTGQYLEPAPGESAMNILKMARMGLGADLATALQKSVMQKEPVRRAGVRVKTNGDYTTVHLTVRPVPASATQSTSSAAPHLYLVVLEEASAPVLFTEPGTQPAASSSSIAAEEPAETDGFDKPTAHARIAELKQELRAREEYLQTSSEELRSANEEMQSVNEEMQSTNEELETSKEELQSVNEELATVNAELQTKVADLSRANDDMNNLLAGTGIGTLFVDRELRIRRFTPDITQVINLIQTDVGRPVGHIASNLVGDDRLVAGIKDVLQSLEPAEIEVQTRSGAWYLLRILPYRTLENVVDGAVITFTGITELKEAQTLLLETDASRQLAAVVHDSLDAITVQSRDGGILAWNPAAERMYCWSEAEALAMNIREVIPEDLREETRSSMERLGRAETLEPYRTQRLTKDGRVVDVWMTATALVNDAGESYAIATTERGLGHDRAPDNGLPVGSKADDRKD